MRVLLILTLAAALFGADSGGFLVGTVRDRSGAALPTAEVQVFNQETGARQKFRCDAQGRYATSELVAGSYKLVVRVPGFRTSAVPGIQVDRAQTRTADVTVELVPLQQEITVLSAREESDPAGDGLAIGRKSPAATLPINGRDLHGFYALIPGATLTPAGSSDGGQFTVNGQRPNTNTIRIDGVSGNTGLGVSVLPGTYLGSSLPGMTVIGSTSNLAAKEDVEQVELRSSDFAPEYGERPGAHIRVETRSGSADIHGTIFGYLRPREWNASDWFALRYQQPLSPSDLHGLGGSFGGPLVRESTFFFVSAGEDSVKDSAVQLIGVPSLVARSQSHSPYRLLLNAFPQPCGRFQLRQQAIACLPFLQDASLKNTSLRLDQVLRKNGRGFARYSYAPSHASTHDLGFSDTSFNWLSATAGATFEWKKTLHDFRFNYSKAGDTSHSEVASEAQMSALNGFNLVQPLRSIPTILPGSELDAELINPNSIVALSVGGVGQLVTSTGEKSYQMQEEGSYTLSAQLHSHATRIGGDYVRLLPRTTLGLGSWTTSITSPGLSALLGEEPFGVTMSYGKPGFSYGQVYTGSAFAQDTWRVSEQLTALYGIRWTVTPPDTTPFWTLLGGAGTWNGPNTPLHFEQFYSPLDNLNWRTKYTQFAPRLGAAYRFRASNLTLRAGAGLFFDDGIGSLIYTVNLTPLNQWQYLPGAESSLLPEQSDVFYSAPPFRTPRSFQWRTSLERSFGSRSTLSIAYVGSAARQLLRLQAKVDPQTALLQETDFTPYGSSDYDAMELQYTGRISQDLYGLVSYTWGHSIDTGSIGSALYLAQPGLTAAQDRGSSDFDVRHNLNASFTYRLPRFAAAGFLAPLLRGWNFSFALQARGGFPFDLTTTDRLLGFGFANTGRPFLVSGLPLWIRDQQAPGGRRLNPAAFLPSGEFTNGNLGRNVFRGPGLFQIDASLRRQFRLSDTVSFETSITAFNLFNRSNFGNPAAVLGGVLFGQSTSMQSLMMGSGSPTNGLTPVFQSGGPRTVEVTLKLSF